MNIDEVTKDALEIFKLVYPFVQKYGYNAFDIIRQMIGANLHPATITDQQIKAVAQNVLKLNQEVQNA